MEDAIRDLLAKIDDADASVTSLAKGMTENASASDPISLDEELEAGLLFELTEHLTCIKVVAKMLMHLHENGTKE